MMSNKKVVPHNVDIYMTAMSHTVSRSEMINRVSVKFNLVLSLSQLKNAYVRLGLKSSRKACGLKSAQGDIGKTASGYLRKRTRSGWELVHHINWASENGRVVPDGHYIIMVDGDKSNVFPSNLECVSRKQYYEFNRMRLEHPFISGRLALNFAKLKVACDEN